MAAPSYGGPEPNWYTYLHTCDFSTGIN